MNNFFNTEVNFGDSQPNIPVPEINPSMLGQVSKAKGGVIDLDQIVHSAMQRGVQKMGKGGSIKTAGKKLVSLIDDIAKEQKAAMEAGDTATAVAKQMELKEAIKSTVNSPALPRAKPLTDKQIQDFAERMAPQITGELTRAGSGAKTVAGKTQQQFQREKTLPVDRKVLKGKKNPMAPLPEMTLEEQIGGVLLGLPGDPTLARMKLSGIGDVAFEQPVTLHGGPRYGDDEKLWASNIAGASNLVGAGRRASEQYGGAPVYASFMKMPDGFGFANHYLESLMQYTRPDQLPQATRLALEEDIRKGFVKGNKKYEFPNFAGFDDLGAVSEQSLVDSNLRKHIADRLEKGKIYGLRPAGDVQFAVTHPELTNIETGAGGFTIGELRLNDPFTASSHPTYTHDIPGKVLGQTRHPTPYDLLYRDQLEMVKKNPAIAEDPFNTTKLLGARQQIDEQLVNEINEYQERLRRMIGKKDGGLAEGGVPEKRDVSQLFPLKWPADANLHKGRTGVWTDTNDVFTGAMSGLFNTLAGGLRGRVIGTAGIPGDIIEGMSDLEGALPKMERKPKGQTFPQTYKAPPAFKLPTMEDLDTMLPSAGDSHEAKIAQELGQFMPLTGEELAPASRALVSSAKKLAPTAAEMAVELSSKYGVDPRMHIIKPKGGNFLAGTPENSTNKLKTKYGASKFAQATLDEMNEVYNPEALALMSEETREGVTRHFPALQREATIERWIDKKLNPYIKNEMGTEVDPIRLGIERRAAEAEKLKEANQARLAKMEADIAKAKARGKDTTLSENDLERAREKFADEEYIATEGLFHGTSPAEGWGGAANEGSAGFSEGLRGKRERAGVQSEPLGTHPASKKWERTVDAEMRVAHAKHELRNPDSVENNSWLAKVDPESNVYSLDSYADVSFEFRHMIDELKEAMNPASVLPKHLKIAPKDLDKMTVDDVSALSGKISAWRNRQKTKPDLQVANNPATHTFKEYPLDESNPKGVSWRQIKRPEGYSDEEAEKFVRDATKYEGDIMRHCVGGAGHCEPLLNGDVEIYTLRDAKGEPHVTIEVEPAKKPYPASGEEFAMLDPATKAQYSHYVREWRQRNPNIDDLTDEHVYQALREAGVPPKPPRILEIKGKNNRKPNPEYIPFVQDFVKSGNFSSVGDLHHTDLQPTKGTPWRKTYESFGMNIPDYVSMDEYDDIVKQYNVLLRQKNAGKAEGGAVRMAEGGAVNLDDLVAQALSNRAPVNLDDIVNQALTKKFAEGGAAYNTVPDMSDGGQFIQSEAF